MLRTLTIVNQARTGVYDSVYFALVEREGRELATAAARLVNNLRSTCPFRAPALLPGGRIFLWIDLHSESPSSISRLSSLARAATIVSCNFR
jgi:hypothetical protein